MLIKDYPIEERPRERCLKFGTTALSNVELIAILIGSGTREESALAVASRILKEGNGLRNLFYMTKQELMEIRGIGQAKALVLLCSIELVKRMIRLQAQSLHVIENADEAAKYMMNQLRFLRNEHFVCLYLDVKKQVVEQKLISIGSLQSTVVHPREVFIHAIKVKAASMICFHNHPSGNPTPSHQDVELTKCLMNAGKIIGIPLLDHIIIGENKYVSLRHLGHFEE